MTPRRTRITLPGAEVSVCEWAPADESGLPLLLLHGGGADSAALSWGGIAPELAAAGHRVIAPDHPGFGESPRADWPVTQERLVQYVGDLVDALALRDYAVAGLSLGGGMTLGHLLARPGEARAAALLGCYGLMPRLADGPTAALTQLSTFLLLRTGLLAAMTRSYARNPAAMERGLRDLVRSPEARTPELVRAVLAEAADGRGLTTFGEWQRDQVGWNGLRTVYTDRLAEIDTPVLLVHGDRDSGVPLARVETAARLLPHARLVVAPDAGHWVQRDRPDVVLPALLQHLAENAHA
ncbi:alpha/beta fold hydrolase [Microbacterium sp. p3-SID336]|uniref:alpha/beta fold hydrolase n=1 Tax=Microbacterium sp. p3-SID336 TaxID=2916212 RepID=UPI0021A29B5C|nr:alpha/beta hydrolase [Microbacterium sp. p3-SID336]MCT1478231.1 alpha/beta hydrolase [Microbacterium sp. p3-SID336]